jgi:hypothetical protein
LKLIAATIAPPTAQSRALYAMLEIRPNLLRPRGLFGFPAFDESIVAIA